MEQRYLIDENPTLIFFRNPEILYKKHFTIKSEKLAPDKIKKYR